MYNVLACLGLTVVVCFTIWVLWRIGMDPDVYRHYTDTDDFYDDGYQDRLDSEEAHERKLLEAMVWMREQKVERCDRQPHKEAVQRQLNRWLDALDRAEGA